MIKIAKQSKAPKKTTRTKTFLKCLFQRLAIKKIKKVFLMKQHC